MIIKNESQMSELLLLGFHFDLLNTLRRFVSALFHGVIKKSFLASPCNFDNFISFARGERTGKSNQEEGDYPDEKNFSDSHSLG
jgi:hypothetical protein